MVHCNLAQALESAKQRVGPAAAATLTAALLFVGQPQVVLADEARGPVNVCDVAEVPPLVLPGANTGPPGAEGEQLMMQGMTVPGFDPRRYSGRWYEVASLKQGFAGQGQEDCHCTQGVYHFDEAKRQISVDTFCVHGSPTGYTTGIRGVVSCVKPEELRKLQNVDVDPSLVGKCFLRFPSIPFIPRAPYDVIATDYDNFAIVSGAKGTTFVQIYSRTANPGNDFIREKKELLGSIGYNVDAIRDTPQDCEETTTEQLEQLMEGPDADAMTNRFPVAVVSSTNKGITLNAPKDTAKAVVEFFRGFGKGIWN